MAALATLCSALLVSGCGAGRPDFKSVAVRVPVVGRLSVPTELAGQGGCGTQACAAGAGFPMAILWAIAGIGALVVVAGICAALVVLGRRRGKGGTDARP